MTRGKPMNHPQAARGNKGGGKPGETETMSLLKEAFVCISIPVAAFALAYIALDTLIGLILG